MLKFLKNAHSGGDGDLFGKEKRRKKRAKEIARERRRLLKLGPKSVGQREDQEASEITEKARELNQAANARRKKMDLPPLTARDVKEIPVFRNGGAVMKSRGGTFKGTF
jgi:hypothetical protein|tara:strand:- start:46 stop:372 length:327 start_codon:yes stop_codon:yes gene_type:complete